MSRKRLLLSAFLFMILSFLLNGNARLAAAEEEATICKGVFIDEVDLSGMTKSQAQAAVNDFVESLRNKGVAVMVGDNIVYSTMGNLGYTAKQMDDEINEALALGKKGNLIKRYKDLKDIEQGNKVYPLNFTYDEGLIKEWVSTDISAYNIAPVNASIARKNGQFIYTDEVKGSKVNVKLTSKAIADAMSNWDRQDILVEAVMEDDLPKYTREDVEKCNTIIGSYTTDFSSSASGRAANLENGARLINNMVLYPGDEFNAYNALTPFTEENGYHIAGAYLNGQVIDSVGGGACQVTTTLYNAVLAAELEVTERQPHSMTISYVELSRDAAIAGTYKNFRFKNSTDAPIVIEAYTKNRKITFNIWGHETRDTKNRKVEYETKILSTTKPPADVVTKDPTKPTTYRKVTQSAHTGYKAQLYKVVYENGVEVSRTLVNTSTYKATPQYVTIGTKKVEEEPAKDSAGSGKDEKPKKPSGNDNPKVEEPSQDDQPLNEWDPAWDFEEPVE